jgi:O-antigen/teichoic acid export membrane protein
LEFDRVSILVTAIYSIALLPHAFYTSLLAIFNALERMELSGVMQIVMSATHLIVGFLILRWRPDVVVLAFSLPFAMGIASGLGFSILRRIRFALPEFSLSTIRNLLRVGYPFMLVNVLTYVFQKADVLLLSVIKGDAAVGWYGAAYNFLDVIMFLPLAYTVAIFPRLSRAAHHKDEELRNVLIQSLKHLFCFGLFFAVTIAVFADQLILWIYKEAFVNSVVLLRVLILGLVFMFPNSLMGYVLFSKHKQEQLVKVFVVNLAVNVLLNLFAIPKYGPLGAALAMLVSLMSSFLFLIFLVNRYLARLDLSELVLRPIVVASVYLGLLAILYPLNQVLALVVGVVLYLLLYWLSGLLEPEEKQLLCSVCLYPTRKLYLFIRAAIGDNR